jgi:hypothetical protein
MDTANAAPAFAERTAEIQQPRPIFERAASISHGRAKGSRSRTTMAVETLLEREAERIASKVVEKALEGDMVALRLCVERLLPARRDRPVAFDLPTIQNAADALNASSAILAACASGTLSPGEATEIMSLVSTHVRMLEMTEIEARLIAVEKAHKP